MSSAAAKKGSKQTHASKPPTWSKIEGGARGRGRSSQVKGISTKRAGTARKKAGLRPLPTGRGEKSTPMWEIPSHLRRELAALALAVAGVLLIVGLMAWAGGGGGIVGLVGMVVAQLFGVVAWLVPIALLAGAGLLVRSKKYEVESRKEPSSSFLPHTSYFVLGTILMLLGIMGLLHLFVNGQRAAELGQGGGYLGLAISTFLADYLTRLGAGVVLVALIVLGAMLAFGLSLMQLARAIAECGVRSADVLRRTVAWIERRIKSRREPHYALRTPQSRELIRINGEEVSIEQTASYTRSTEFESQGGVRDEDFWPVQAPLVLGEGSPQQVSSAGYQAQGATDARVLTPDTHQPTPDSRRPAPIINFPEKKKGTTNPQPMVPVMSPLGYVWNLPPVSLLEEPSEVKVSQSDIKAKIKVLEETLQSFSVDAAVREVNSGPAVTQFALEPGVGVRVNRITSLERDIALALAAPHIRLEAPIPGQSRVGIEVPNSSLQVVGLRGVMESEVFAGSKGRLKIALGRDTHGRAVVTDLTKLPHLLVAGATGSGKSVFLNSMVIGYLLQFTPDDLRMLMIDPKRVELTGFNGIPHLLRPVVTDIRMDKDQAAEGRRQKSESTGSDTRALTAVEALKWALWEMERRYKVFSKGVKDNEGITKVFRNIEGYRTFQKENPHTGMEYLPYIVIIIDELADLMLTAPEEVETSLCRLAQLARATGIHLIVATQRPSVDVVTGLIKANFPARAAFAVTSQVDSKVILDGSGAEKLLGRGDMLYTASDESKPVRIQGVFVSDAESDRVVNFWRKQLPVEQPGEGSRPGNNGNPAAGSQGPAAKNHSAYEMQIPDWLGKGDPDEASELLEQAIELAKKSEYVSVSMLQRKLRIGYNRAAGLVEQMEDLGLIAPATAENRGKPREVLLGAPDSRATPEVTSDE